MKEGPETRIVAFASRKSAKKWRRNKEQQNEAVLQNIKSLENNNGVDGDPNPSSEGGVVDEKLSFVNRSVRNGVPSRRQVIQDCTLTSGLIAALELGVSKVRFVGVEKLV